MSRTSRTIFLVAIAGTGFVFAGDGAGAGAGYRMTHHGFGSGAVSTSTGGLRLTGGVEPVAGAMISADGHVLSGGFMANRAVFIFAGDFE